MNDKDRRFFNELHNDRLENSVVFEKPSVRGFWTNIVEKYSDQAHFIYELLQNADDTGATTVSFELYPDRLVFRHNGTRHFSVSDPQKENEDTLSGSLGDLNSITSIANSNKNNQSTIGKFGVGFKAVFLYTSTPIIYDPCVAFRLEKYIVPYLVEEDYPGRKKDETVFIFPFNHPKKSAAEAYENINLKLRALVYPQLFLPHIQTIAFTIGNESGQYSKKIRSTQYFGKTKIEDVRLVFRNRSMGESREDDLWLCSRETEDGNQYCVGYFHNEKGRLSPKDLPAFCFFPTKEKTGLHFILHAPFLLTDSREGIQAGIPHNRNMVNLLADLAAEGLVLLCDIGKKSNRSIIDKNLFSIVPYNEEDFGELDDRDSLSFMPFYTAIKAVLKKEEILPSTEGYVDAEHAYWANMSQTSEMFANDQLQLLVGNHNAKWLDIGSGYQSTKASNYKLYRYFSWELYLCKKDDDDLIDSIDGGFIANQSKEWLLSFYKYVAANRERVDKVRYRQVFIDNAGKPAAAYKNDYGEQAVLFLPSNGISGFPTIHPDYAKHKETLDLAKALEIREPSMKEEIYNIILPQYKENEITDAAKNYFKFYNYYLTCSKSEAEAFIKLIRDKHILHCHTLQDPKDYLLIPGESYIMTESNRVYLEMLPEVWVVNMDFYRRYGKPDQDTFHEFLIKLGVREYPKLEVLKLEENTKYKGEYVTEGSMYKYAAPGTTWAYTTGNYVSTWFLPTIPGIEDVLKKIEDTHNLEASKFVWNLFLSIDSDSYRFYWSSDNIYRDMFRGRFEYFYRTSKTQGFETHLPVLFRSTKWIKTVSGEFAAPEDLSLDDLTNDYNITHERVTALAKFLNIQVEEDAPDEALSQKQKDLIDIGKFLSDRGYSLKDLPDLLDKVDELKKREKITIDSETREKNEKSNKKMTIETPKEEHDSFISEPSTPKEKVLHDIFEISEKKSSHKASPEKTPEKKAPISPVEELDQFLTDDDEPDEDEFTPSTVDYEKKIEKAKEKSAEAIDLITLTQEYESIAASSPKYSFSWFKALLNLEIINSSQNKSNRKNISISFGKVRRESENNRTLILEHPDRYIPQNIEDVADVAMILRGDSFEKLAAIEVVNIRSYTLRVKLKNLGQISGIDLEKVKQATISIQNPVFLLEELKKAFTSLPFDDDYNLRENLRKDIYFVFGPPGTGKTTYLADKVILPLVKKHSELKILVLAPTNKAADVLTTRIMEKAPLHEYIRWLVRFGVTADDRIESSGVFREKTTDIRTFAQSVVVTTLARFPYDYFIPAEGKRLLLSEMDWDYIIFDEASMIRLIEIVYPLYKLKPYHFIVAGDPFQIEPIVSVKQWKDENIYTMTGLNSFNSQVKTYPHEYKIKRLMTQYRSLPSVGSVFSNFAYGGVLQHNRREEDQKELLLGDDLSLKSLNIIKFPTSKYESIYRPKRLYKSNYQIYSALFTFEFCCFLAGRISKHYPGKEFSIGIVAPYRAEADLIEKLSNTISLPREIRIQAGTIHGFQGDECDIVMVVLNTPPRISSDPDMFLNKKNIINVAISRARDYLFLIMPDDNTDGINNLRLVKKVEALCRKQPGNCQCYTTEELERVMFNQPDYLELNSFSTGHQSVNVYGLPEMKYEIRSEDTAVDVQIHDADAKMVNQHSEEWDNTAIGTMADIDIEDEKNDVVNDGLQLCVETVSKPAAIQQEGAALVTNEKAARNSEYESAVDHDHPIVDYYRMPFKIGECPFDNSKLGIKAVPVWKHTVKKEKKIPFCVCRKCGKRFLLEKEACRDLTEYNLLSMELPLEAQLNLVPFKKGDYAGPRMDPQEPKKAKKKKTANIYDYAYGDHVASRRYSIGGQKPTGVCRYYNCGAEVYKDGLCWWHFKDELDSLND